MFKKYLLASTAAFSPPDEFGNNGADDQGNDQNVEDQGDEEGQEPDEVLEGQDAGAEEGQDGPDDAEGDDEGSVDQPPRRNRAQSRIQSLRSQIEEERVSRQRMERELQELREATQRTRQQAQEESPEARAARRALMSDTELMREDLKESEARTAKLLQQVQQSQMESSDRNHYEAILRDSPSLRKYHADVEKLRSEAAAKGNFIPREALLDIVIGRAARTAATRQAQKPAGKRQNREVERNQSRQANSRSDTATSRGRQGSTPESRLDGVPI